MSNCKNESKHCISCDVKNCVYHTMDNRCSAGEIKVGPGEASTSRDTCCDTFRAEG